MKADAITCSTPGRAGQVKGPHIGKGFDRTLVGRLRQLTQQKQAGGVNHSSAKCKVQSAKGAIPERPALLVLAAPPDNRVRPTSDRTRQAIFNMLMHKDFGIGFALEGAARSAAGPAPPHRA